MKITKSHLLQAVRTVRDEIYEAVKLQLADDRHTYQQIADTNCISLATVQRIAERSGITRQVGPRPKSFRENEEENNDQRYQWNEDPGHTLA